jgi:predicted DNA-binding transcriptional regulator YafY
MPMDVLPHSFALHRTRSESIVARLQDGSGKSLKELSAAFGVSPRTILRDLASLVANGVPIQSGARGYRLEAGYRVPPLWLGEAEAIAVLAGLHQMALSRDERLAYASSSAIAKLLDALSAVRSPARDQGPP